MLVRWKNGSVLHSCVANNFVLLCLWSRQHGPPICNKLLLLFLYSQDLGNVKSKPPKNSTDFYTKNDTHIFPFTNFKSEFAGVTFSHSNSAPVSKFANPGRGRGHDFFFVWESDSSSGSGTIDPTEIHPRFYLRNYHADSSCYYRIEKVTPDTGLVTSRIYDLRFFFHAMCLCTERYSTYQIRWEKGLVFS